MGCNAGSSVRLQDGDLAESHATVTYRSFNRDRGLTFTYHSTGADPRPVVVASATIPDFMPIPSRLSTRLRIGGSLVNEEVFTGLAGFDDDVSEELHFASQFDAAAFATGSYPYEFLLKSDYRGVVLSGAQVTRRSVGRLFLRNEIASPFGAGWGLEGLERLSEQFDKAQLLLKGGGTTQLFEPETENDTLFTNPEILSGVPGARHHAIGDLNGDGAPEIAAPTPTGGGTVVFWNDGSGRFLSSSFVATAGSAVASRIADFNNDGHGDIVTGHSNAAGQFMVHIGDGAGGFTLWATVPVGLPMSETQVGDFDGDGFMDVIFASSPSGDDFLRIYYGDGSGGFTNDYGRSFGGFSRAGLAVGDINGDGLDDWALGYNLGNTTTYGLSNGPARSFSTSFTNADANGARDGTNAISDMNQDGFGELLSGDEAARFQQNVGNATGFVSRLAQSHALITNLRALAVGDLNGDGFKDVATTRGSGLSGVQIRFGRGNLSYEPALLVETGPNPGRSIAIGDLDGDGIDDIVLNDPVAGGLIVLRAVDPDAFASPAGEFSTLARNPDGSFTRRTKDGTLHDYDPEGLLTAVTDRNGNATTYAYDAQDRIETITDPAGLITTFAYGADGKLDSVTDPASRVTQFQHDAAGDLVKIIDPDLSERDFAYDARHRLISQFSKRDFETTYDYGFHGRATAAHRPDGSDNLFSPSQVVGLIDTSLDGGTLGSFANPAPFVRPDAVEASFTDGNGNLTTYGLDRFGAATMVEDALLRVVDSERDDDSLITQRTLPNGRLDQFVYDAMGNLLTRTEAVGDPLERSTNFEYEPLFNQVTKITDAELNETVFDYDAGGNLVAITDAHLTEMRLSYSDPNCPGFVTSIVEAFGLPEEAMSISSYDPVSCNTSSTLDPLNNPTSVLYDVFGNITHVTDALGRQMRFQYDVMSRTVMTVDARNTAPMPACATLGVTCMAYDAAGNLESVTDGNGSVIDFDYDERDRVSQRTDPLLAVETYDYDGNGNLAFITDRKGQVIEQRYDAVDRLEEKILLPGMVNESVRAYDYDVMDNLTAVSDPASALTYSYDLLNRLETASTAGAPHQPAVTLTTDYDGNDNRTSLDDDLIGITAYSYDALNRLDDVTPPGQGLIDFAYDPLSRRTLIDRPNGTTSVFTYDVASRLDTITHALGAATLASFDYGVDAVGKRTSLDQTRSTVAATPAITYGYDATDQLTGATAADLGGTVESYSYDALGNRITSHLSTAHSHDAANRLLEDDQACYAYDANGNLTTKTVKVAGVCTGAVTTHHWDPENRLVQIDLPGGSIARYIYDGLNRRIQKDVDGTVTTYLYDEEDILFEFAGDGPSATLVARYAHGAGIDEALVIQRDLDASGSFGAGEAFNYHTDGLGSITGVTDELGAVAGETVYDSFGAVLVQTGTLDSPYGFTGRELDPESGLNYYRARYYDSAVGRFDGEDPLGLVAGDENLYRYVGNSPTNFLDPEGLQAVPVPGGGLAPPLPPITIPGSPDNQRWVDAVKDLLDKLNVFRNWTCTASCNVQQIDKCANCPDRVTGTGTGKTEAAACSNAKADANRSVPRGCYKRHCQCNCRR